MRAGALRHRITIESRTDTRSEVGQMVPAWAALFEDVPADFNPDRGREYFEAQGAVVVEPARFRIGFRESVVATMRVIFRDKVWDIAAVEDVGGRRRSMYLYCNTGLTEG